MASTAPHAPARRTTAPDPRGAGRRAAGRSVPLRLLGALLAVGVVVIHIQDQGGVTALTDPAWMGWAYRALEVGGVLVALALVARVLLRFTWTCALLVAVGPLVGYVLTRSTGLPQATDDVGNWTDPLGIASLVVEGLLVVVSLVALGSLRRERARVLETPVYPADTPVAQRAAGRRRAAA